MNLPERLIVAILAFTAAAAAEALPAVTFTLNPLDGFIAGAAGTSVGWGYTIGSTSPSDPFGSLEIIPSFVVIESFLFGDLTPVGSFSQPGVPSTEATDGSPIIVPWSPGVSGLQYDIDPGAPLGSSSQGAMSLIYDVYYDSDPNNAVESGLTVNAQFQGRDVNAEVFVNAPSASVPEPGALTLLVLGLAALLLRMRACAITSRFDSF